MEEKQRKKDLQVPPLRFPGFTDEWKNVTFKEVVTLQRGSSPRPIVNYITHDDSGVNWIRIGDMPSIGRLVTQTEEKITVEGAIKSRHVNIGDLILSNSMSFGQPYIMGIEGYIHDGWFVLKNFEKYIDRDFLCNLLIAPIIQKQYSKLAAGGVVQNISSELVNSVKFSIPPLYEQQKIVSLLNAIDERIELQNKIINKMQSLIKGLAKTLTHPEESNTKVSDCLDCHTSSLQEGTLNDNGQYPVYGASGIAGFLDDYRCDEDAILIIKDGSGAGTVSYAAGEYSVIGTLNYLTAKPGYSLKYLYFCLMSLNFEPFKTGMAIPHIYFKDYGQAKIYCPPVESQDHIAKVLTIIENKLDIESQLLNSLYMEKQYFLSNMFI